AQAGFTPGEKPTVIETSIGRIGILMGLETLDTQCIHALVAQGVQLILSPSIVTADSCEEIHSEVVNWSKRLSKLATIARSHVLWANKCGLVAGKVAIGSSMIVDPHGKILSCAKIDQDEIVRSTVTLTGSPLFTNMVDRA
ncbi:MAG: nitrilase-related carbon-nitrogen hydrolase, partial [Armatimonadota bacterium]